MFDERFARQYRYEPPPEFPLASPYTGIVHHLSGPDRCAPTQTFHRRSGSVDGANVPPITFITRTGLTPKHSHICQTPWSVFQDGSVETILSGSRCCGWMRSRRVGGEALLGSTFTDAPDVNTEPQSNMRPRSIARQRRETPTEAERNTG